MNQNQDVTNYINKGSTYQVKLLSELRDLIHSTVPNTAESIKWGFPVFGNPKDFSYLRHSKNHITLGFYNIDKIDDPDTILEGSGKTLKHIKIKNETDIPTTQLKNWLSAISQ